MTTIGFFNNKGGVGKTSLVYHIAWMLSELGVAVIAADLDPQANLTSMFLPDERLEELWEDEAPGTVHGAMRPLLEGGGDIAAEPHVEPVDERIGLLVGDLRLSGIEDELSRVWPDCLSSQTVTQVRAFRVISAFARLIAAAAESRAAAVALVDVGPNLGAINRAALLACDFLVIPLGADLFSLQGLRNMGPTIRGWRQEWVDRLERRPSKPPLSLPPGSMKPLGYVIMRHSVRLDRPVRAYDKWIARIPGDYATSVLDDERSPAPGPDRDSNRLALLKDYRSLMPLAQEARKPMFLLKPADGAFGGHQSAVAECYKDFGTLTRGIMDRCGVTLPRARLPAQ